MDKVFWEQRWETGQTGWDLGEVSPPLKEYIDQLKNKSIKILIPGAGNAYEAKYLWQKGFKHITVVDIAQKIINQLEEALFDTNIMLVNNDFFAIKGQYDLVLEQTFFCALRPSERVRYVQKMAQILKPEGRLVGVLFNCEFDGGPPFGGSVNEYKTLFSRHFDLLKMEPCYNSVSPREGREVWVEMKNRTELNPIK